MPDLIRRPKTKGAYAWPDARVRFEVTKDFIAFYSGDGFKFEIVVRAESGSRTVPESCLKVKR